MIGQEITNVTLTANTELIIAYPISQQACDVVNYGPGAVYLNWQATPTVGGANCLRLDEGQTYEIRTRYHWHTLHLISDGVPAIQAVVR